MTIEKEIEEIVPDDTIGPMLEELLALMKETATNKSTEKNNSFFEKVQGTNDMSEVISILKDLNTKISDLDTGKQSESPSDISIERDANGLVTSINGKPIKRESRPTPKVKTTRVPIRQSITSDFHELKESFSLRVAIR